MIGLNVAPVFQQMKSKTKTSSAIPCTRDFSRALRKLLVITRSSDWFIALFASVVIGWSNYFGIYSHLKTALLELLIWDFEFPLNFVALL